MLSPLVALLEDPCFSGVGLTLRYAEPFHGHFTVLPLLRSSASRDHSNSQSLYRLSEDQDMTFTDLLAIKGDLLTLPGSIDRSYFQH